MTIPTFGWQDGEPPDLDAENLEAMLGVAGTYTDELRADMNAADLLLAPLVSPALTGTPTAPTPTSLDHSTKVATTAYADNAVAAEATARTTADALKAPLASPALTGNPTAPTATPGDNDTSIATTAFVTQAVSVGGGGGGAVSSVFTRTGAVTATSGDYSVGQITGAAPLASPTLTGTPIVPTATAGTNTTQVASTAFVTGAIATEVTRAETAEGLLAPKASPALTGTPTAPTQAANDNTTKVATTAYADRSASNAVSGLSIPAASSTTPIVDGTGAAGSATPYARQDHVHPTDTSRAALASPTFTGTPAAPTATSGTNTTQIATTAFVATNYQPLTPRVNSITSSATPAINVGTTDQFEITALAVPITSMTSGLTGAPADGQRMLIRFKDNGTGRAIMWGASFISSGIATLLSTTIATKTHMVGLIYDSSKAVWVCTAVDATGY